MKRVDFDPNGKRNCQNRGISGYDRISWEEALDIVANEIKRVKKDVRSGCHSEWQRLPPPVGNPGLLAERQTEILQ